MRRPGLRQRGIIAAGSPYTADAGRAILDAGGNAVDAAVAAAFASFVCEPMLTDIGGGGFMLVDRGHEAEILDFFVAVPGLGIRTARRTSDLDFGPLEIDFGDARQVFHVGLGAAAVPGNVHGLCTAHARWGRLPLCEVVEPAVQFGRQGVALTADMAAVLGVIAPIFARDPTLRRDVLDGGGTPVAGQMLRLAHTADLIDAIGREGLELFYRGEVARRMVDQCRRAGGLITRTDLSAYRTEIRAPLPIDVFGSRIQLNSPPSTGGALVALGLELASDVEWAQVSPNVDSERGVVALALLFEVTATARAEVLDRVLLGGGYTQHLLGDPEHRSDYARRLRSRLALAPPPSAEQARPGGRGATTHISVVDEQGWAVSVTTSNGEGSGVAVGDTGIHLNNMLGEEDLNPGGFHLYPAGNRLPSMMCPASVRRDDGLVVSLGSGGANRIRTAIVQTLLRVVVYDQVLARAVSAPRVHWEAGTLDVEPRQNASDYEALEAAGFRLRRFRSPSLYFGGVHTAARLPDGTFDAAGDSRRGGCVR